VLVGLARAAWRDLVNPRLRPLPLPGWFGWFALAVIAAFWIARNLPWAAFVWMRA
jgi:hypothetical protein